MENYEKRLKTLTSNPHEFFGILTNSINTFFIKTELESACNHKQYNLLLLGIHAVIETISEQVFLKRGPAGFKYYLEHFVDGKTEDLKFSTVATIINDWRNIVAHQWLSKLGHSFGFDDAIQKGFNVDKLGMFHLNPIKYFEQFKYGFGNGNETTYNIWEYENLLTETELKRAQQKFIEQYQRR